MQQVYSDQIEVQSERFQLRHGTEHVLSTITRVQSKSGLWDNSRGNSICQRKLSSRRLKCGTGAVLRHTNPC